MVHSLSKRLNFLPDIGLQHQHQPAPHHHHSSWSEAQRGARQPSQTWSCCSQSAKQALEKPIPIVRKTLLEELEGANRTQVWFLFSFELEWFWAPSNNDRVCFNLNSEVGPLASTNLGAHSRSLKLKFVCCFEVPSVLEFLEQTAVVRVTMTAERLKGFQVLELEVTLSKLRTRGVTWSRS